MTGCINIKPKERRCCNIETYKCPVCGNTDVHSIGYLNGKPYCRRCISFKGEEVEHKPSYPKKAPIHLEYELSPEQKELSDKLVENYKKGIDSLVFAVCGSGKTEIVLNVISYAIRCGEKVAFAIPRRDVVVEILDRIKQIFKRNKVIGLYGGHTDQFEGDVVILTTHQLYRYKDYFDLIVIDEIDAFPYKNNPTLNAMLFRALKGHLVMLSATPDNKTIQLFSTQGHEILKLNKRFHGHPLPVPFVVKSKYFYIFKLFSVLSKIIKKDKQCFIFCPTIKISEQVFTLLKMRFKNGDCVHSKKKERDRIIHDFKKGKIRYLVTTAVLERGVTVKDLQVIVFLADHSIYDTAALVQISGRVGRKKQAPTGEVIYIVRETTKAIEESIQQIKDSNSDMSDMF